MEQIDLERLIGELEIAVDRVRSLYEQYFMGIEKLEPTVPRKDVDRRIHVLRKEQIRNTALRFRFQMLLQRYNTYQTHWQRICRDIENGTYKRHVIRAQRRFGMQPFAVGPKVAAGAAPRSFAEELAALDREFAPAETLSDADVDPEEEAPTTPNRPPSSSRVAAASGPASSRGALPRSPRSPPPRPPPARTPRPPKPDSRPAPASSRAAAAPPSSRPAASPPSSRPVASPPRAVGLPSVRRPNVAVRPAPGSGPVDGSDLPEERVRQLYSLFIEAKRRQNESTAAITYEAVARTIRASSAKLRQKLGKPVDFEIAVKDGHAIIRPVVK